MIVIKVGYQIAVKDGITVTPPAPPAATSGGTKPPTTANRGREMLAM